MFPDAWAIEKNADQKALSERFNEAANLDLYSAYRANRDAVLLCEDDPALLGDYSRGLHSIEAIAGLRGFDLETGKHDAAKAKDPALATQHVDQLPDSTKVIRKDRQAVQTR